jgi:hypothetical protein
VTEILQRGGSPQIRWLRECGRYLSPAGATDARLAMAVVLRNWFTLLWVVGLFLFAIFTLGAGARQLLWHFGDATSGVWRDFELWLIARAGHPIWWSPMLGLALLPIVVGVIPNAWAFWFTQRDRSPFQNMPLVCTLAAALSAAVLICKPASLGLDQTSPLLFGFAIGIFAMGALAFLQWAFAMRGKPGDTHVISRARNRVTRWLSTWMVVAGVMIAAGLVDSLGQTVYALLVTDAVASDGGRILSPAVIASSLASLAPLVAGGRFLVGKLTAEGTGGGASTKMLVVATIAALLITLISLTAIAVGGHAILWRGGIPANDPGAEFAKVHCPKQPEVTLTGDLLIQVSKPTPFGATEAAKTVEPDPIIWIAFAIAFVVSLATSRTFAFLNLSSYQGLYGARLTRAYLGGSNPGRVGPAGVRITETIEGDDLSFADYAPYRVGGPLHFVNVTLNETVDGKSEIEQRDRKGLPMAVGPFAMSVGVKHHALWQKKPEDEPANSHATVVDPIPLPAGYFPVFPPDDPDPKKRRTIEALTLGNWMGISGAAFSTGLGSRTSLAFSLLAGFANVRLGYWFDSGIGPRVRERARQAANQANGATASHRSISSFALAVATEAFPVQVQLLEEFLARFHGTARERWYLTDGGHFENTACYELIRRRVPFILCCDDGADPDYAFEDAAALVRIARADLHAEIEFITAPTAKDDDDAPRSALGTLADLKREFAPDTKNGAVAVDEKTKNRFARSHAVLASVKYDGEKVARSHILFLKPALTGDEPVDILQYQRAHPPFPQEPTSDQFFDEAQWESYRGLGEHVVTQVFKSLAKDAAWLPKQFKPR